MKHCNKRAGILGIGLMAMAVLQAGAIPTGGGAGDLLPSLSDRGAWSVADSGGLEVGIGEAAARDPNTFAARIFKVDGTDWHASIAERTPVQFVDGHRYTLTLLARANTARDIRVIAISTAKDRHNVGLDATLPIGFGYQAFTESFIARNTNGHPSKVSFAVGQTTGLVWIQQLNLADNGPSASTPRSS